MRRTANSWIHRVEAHGNTILQPKPFAGKYPTRIRWRVTTGAKTFSYIGKPSRIAIQRLLKCVANYPGAIISFLEVDQRNVLCHLSTDGRRFETARSSFYSGWNAYHPFTSNIKGWEWLFQPWWRLKLHKMPIYSPVQNLDSKLHIATYGRWFASIGWLIPGKGW